MNSKGTDSVRVGFVGIGNMGRPMAKNIAAAGYATILYDVDTAKASEFAATCGATAVDSPEALGSACDVVVTMLPKGSDVRAVVCGTDGHGIAATLRSGAVVIDMSSSDPVGTRELGATLNERGIALVDAPVSGLVSRAESGTLTIMIGSDDEAALHAATPILECLGERLIRIGALGAGHAMKALNNYVGAAAFAATAEALIVGKKFGLDPAVMTEVFDVSTGRSFHSGMTFPDHVIPRRFETGFTLGLLAKDVGIAGHLGEAVEANTPLLELVTAMFAEGCKAVGADADNSAVVRHWERRNGVVIESGQSPEQTK
ncbi:MAG: NAD(P)-dependent oxidoreductase [Gammaproteobacteria bacterium]|jgi:3-hydroxyisobutyrate dehydrogenase